MKRFLKTVFCVLTISSVAFFSGCGGEEGGDTGGDTGSETSETDGAAEGGEGSGN